MINNLPKILANLHAYLSLINLGISKLDSKVIALKQGIYRISSTTNKLLKKICRITLPYKE